MEPDDVQDLWIGFDNRNIDSFSPQNPYIFVLPNLHFYKGLQELVRTKTFIFWDNTAQINTKEV